MFHRRQRKLNSHWSWNVKSFHPLARNAWFFLSGASVSIWILCNSCIRVPQLSSVWKDGSQNNTVIVGKGSNLGCAIWTKNIYHDFYIYPISILITILTQTDMLYSYKCILCEFETYFQRKPIRPFPKSCNMSLEQTYGKIHIYIYIYILYVYVSNQIQQNKMQPEHVSGSIFRFVGVSSVVHGQSKRSANVPLTLTGKPNPAQITRSH